MKLKVEKDTYSIGELITIKLEIINRNKNPISIEYNCAFEDDIALYLDIISENGFIYRRQPGIVYDCIGTGIKLRTGEIYKTYGIPLIICMENLIRLILRLFLMKALTIFC